MREEFTKKLYKYQIFIHAVRFKMFEYCDYCCIKTKTAKPGRHSVVEFPSAFWLTLLAFALAGNRIIRKIWFGN